MAERLYLFRHAATEVTEEQDRLGVVIAYGDTNLTAPILPDYFEPVLKIAWFLSFQDLTGGFTSPVLRCKQTVEKIEDILGLGFEDDPNIGEGVGETNERVETRLRTFLDEKVTGRNHSTLAICTHAANISGIVSLLIGIPKVTDPLQFPDPGVLTTIEGGKVTELDFNNPASIY